MVNVTVYKGCTADVSGSMILIVSLGGLVVGVLATGPKIRGFKPD
jgi:hypothetical protein